jgi:hypothetical protein
MQPTPSGSTIRDLLTELRDEGTTLLRQEVALAKAELKETAAEVGRNSAGVAVGGAIAYAGGLVLLIGIGALAGRSLEAMGMSEDIAQWLGFVIVGALTAFIGWTKLAKAKRALRAGSLVPRETLASLRENKRWASEKIHHPRHEPAT